jgi:hypothetical protein
MPITRNALSAIMANIHCPRCGRCTRTDGSQRTTVTEQEEKLSPVIVGMGSFFMKIIDAGRSEDALVPAQALPARHPCGSSLSR